MASRMGLLGKKVGMTQTFDKTGNWLALTVIELGPCAILQVNSEKRNGYTSLQLGFDEQKPQRVNRPRTGVFAKANATPRRFVREIRLEGDEIGQFEMGQSLTVEQVFREGDIIDITGTSKGKGFQGVMKRYHFSGFRATHGTHEYFRHGGSIGCRLTPGRVYKGRRMPGQMGNERVTVQNLRVYEVIPERNLLLVRGAVPGAPGTYVTVKHGAKRLLPPFELIAPAPAPEATPAEETAAEG